MIQEGAELTSESQTPPAVGKLILKLKNKVQNNLFQVKVSLMT